MNAQDALVNNIYRMEYEDIDEGNSGAQRRHVFEGNLEVSITNSQTKMHAKCDGL